MSKKQIRSKLKNTPPKPSIWRRVLLVLGVLAGLLILAAAGVVAYSAVRRGQTVSLPAPTGPYAVGRTELDWVDPTRSETFSSQTGKRREILAWVWYPAQPGTSPQAAYLPAAWVQARNADRSPFQVFFQDVGKIQSHSLEKPPILSGSQRFPVIVFSTGYGGIAPEYAALEEDLASRGYVVVGITNPYSAPSVVFPDGHVIERNQAGSINEESDAAASASAGRLAVVWSLDIRLALDQMEQLDTDPVSPFAGRLDMNRVGLAGHSLGGAASVQACGNDLRCKGAVDLDGSLYGDAASIGIGPPVLFVTSEPQEGGSVEDATFTASRKHGAREVEIRGSRHFNFQDGGVTYQPLAHLIGVYGPIDGVQALQVSRDLLAAFFGERLMNQPGGVDAVLKKYAGVVVSQN